MAKLISKCLLFSPLLLLFLWDSIVPIDTFNLRVWEALCVMRPNLVLKGPFYPGINLTKHEAANVMLSFGGRDVRRTNKWVTDRYGYRKQEPYPRPIEIAAIGDSNIAGSGLTQREIFSEVFEEMSGRGTYPIAVGGIESYFIHPYFKTYKPRVVIASFIERNLTLFSPYYASSGNAFRRFVTRLEFRIAEKLLTVPIFLRAGVFVDRVFYKKTLAQFLKTHYLMPLLDQEIGRAKGIEPEIIFFQGEAANEPVSELKIEAAVQTFLSYHEAFKKVGIRFIFMPIPNKETIYYDVLPGQLKSNRLQRLFAGLRAEGVEVVDLETAYMEFKKANPEVLLYDPEDVHWNAQGVRVAAETLQKYLSP